MRQTKKITLSAMMVALSTVFLVLGAFIEVLDLTACALASLSVVFVYIEIGSPYTWLVWLCTSLSTFIISPGKTVWVLYLFVFGIYPILKAYIEKLPRWTWIILKLVFVNAVCWIMIFIFDLIFKMPFIDSDKMWMKVAVYALINIAFIAYDMFITVMVRVYIYRFRPRFKHLLK